MGFMMTQTAVRVRPPTVWAGSQPLSRTPGAVLMALTTFHGPSGEIYPSYETIAQRCYLSVRTVKRAIPYLEAMGYITRERKHRRQQYHYELMVDEGVITPVCTYRDWVEDLETASPKLLEVPPVAPRDEGSRGATSGTPEVPLVAPEVQGSSASTPQGLPPAGGEPPRRGLSAASATEQLEETREGLEEGLPCGAVLEEVPGGHFSGPAGLAEPGARPLSPPSAPTLEEGDDTGPWIYYDTDGELIINEQLASQGDVTTLRSVGKGLANRLRVDPARNQLGYYLKQECSNPQRPSLAEALSVTAQLQEVLTKETP